VDVEGKTLDTTTIELYTEVSDSSRPCSCNKRSPRLVFFSDVAFETKECLANFFATALFGARQRVIFHFQDPRSGRTFQLHTGINDIHHDSDTVLASSINPCFFSVRSFKMIHKEHCSSVCEHRLSSSVASYLLERERQEILLFVFLKWVESVGQRSSRLDKSMIQTRNRLVYSPYPPSVRTFGKPIFIRRVTKTQRVNRSVVGLCVELLLRQ